MINRIDIASFGSFDGLEWKKAIRDSGKNVQNFKRLNIIYGRNYSGKTTLSRVLRALEMRKVPLNHPNASFTIYGDMGNVTHATVTTHSYDVRVYNRDFVTDNLSFLANQVDGEIKTFAIVGELNKEIDDAIVEIETKLGSVDGKSGLWFELEAKKKERDQCKTHYKIATDSLEDKLRSHANEKIKKNRDYGSAVYNIAGIKRDIADTKKPGFTPLTTEEQAAKISLLKQEALPDIAGTLTIQLKLDSLRSSIEPLLSKQITPTDPIQELLNDSILQLWVKQGISHHRDKRDSCAFCRQSLPDNIWQVLDSHFSRESGDLESAIDAAILKVSDEINATLGFNTFRSEQFYPEERYGFDTASKALSDEVEIYKRDLLALKKGLENRKSNLFRTFSLENPLCDADSLQRKVDAINALISASNDRTETLEKDKASARLSLRLTDVYSYCDVIDYDTELVKIAKLETKLGTANTTYGDAEKEIDKAEREVSGLRARQKDERKAAERVNSLLNHFFGHDGIKLEAKKSSDQEAAVYFEITRNGSSAYNLSEGECSLIAFCYFIAKLEEPESKGKDLIIYIDDPISSLDGNHIFFMFSLIESLITKPSKNPDGSNIYRYKQLFISTHNLDFLKYLKRLSIPKKKISTGENKTKAVPDDEHFMIERNGASSNILLMPPYLREYITEFHYLFHQIYKCKNQESANTSHEPFFGFGNNLRKFLEAFLFFKYPYHDDRNDAFERIKKFFGEEEDTAIALVNRLNNEFSHLEAAPDRGFKPVEIPEISKVANYVLDKIYAADPDQYNSLLKSIGEPERTL